LISALNAVAPDFLVRQIDEGGFAALSADLAPPLPVLGIRPAQASGCLFAECIAAHRDVVVQ
jgi:hypothetical protein